MRYLTLALPTIPAADRAVVSRAVRLSFVKDRALRRLRPAGELSPPAGQVLVIELKPGASQRAVLAAVAAVHEATARPRWIVPSSAAWRVWARHDFGGQSFGDIARWARTTTGLHGTTAGSRKVEAQRLYARVVAYRKADPHGLAATLAMHYAPVYIKGSRR